MSEPIIELAGVSKAFRSRRSRVTALNEASLTVYRGDVFGLLGANGAGKTTAMRCVLGLTRIDHGTLRVMGRSRPDRRTLFAKAAFLPEVPQMFAGATARETLYYHGRLCNMDRRRLAARVDEVLAMVSLTGEADRQVGTYSKGMKQRLGVAATVLAEPEILFLDEPTRGLDPIGRREVRDLLAALARHGATLFINSHLLGEVERLCNRVAILVEGQVRSQGRLDELLTIKEGLVVRFALPDEEAARRLPSCERAENGLWKLAVSDTAELARAAEQIAAAGGRVISAQSERVELEDFFLSVVRGGGES